MGGESIIKKSIGLKRHPRQSSHGIHTPTVFSKVQQRTEGREETRMQWTGREDRKGITPRGLSEKRFL